MQVLFEFGKENEIVKGLNIFQGYTDKNINGLNIGYKKIQIQSKIKNSSLEKALSKAKHDGEKKATDAYVVKEPKPKPKPVKKVIKQPKQEWKSSVGTSTLALGAISMNMYW